MIEVAKLFDKKLGEEFVVRLPSSNLIEAKFDEDNFKLK